MDKIKLIKFEENDILVYVYNEPIKNIQPSHVEVSAPRIVCIQDEVNTANKKIY